MRFAPLLAALVAFALAGTSARADDRPITIVALGDSLTAGYMLAPGEGFVPQLQAALREKGHDVKIVESIQRSVVDGIDHDELLKALELPPMPSAPAAAPAPAQ